jgi:hypothetical protein
MPGPAESCRKQQIKGWRPSGQDSVRAGISFQSRQRKQTDVGSASICCSVVCLLVQLLSIMSVP